MGGVDPAASISSWALGVGQAGSLHGIFRAGRAWHSWLGSLMVPLMGLTWCAGDRGWPGVSPIIGRARCRVARYAGQHDWGQRRDDPCSPLPRGIAKTLQDASSRRWLAPLRLSIQT